jgi:hypothetical protein
MDDEDEYGIPSDYYQSEVMLQRYPETGPTSSFDDLLDGTLADNSFEDFSECMRVVVVSVISCQANFCVITDAYCPSAEIHFRGSSEPGLGLLDAATVDHRRLEPGHQYPSGLPLSTSHEFGLSASSCDQGSQCMYAIARAGFFSLTHFFEFASRRARASGVAPYKIHPQTTFNHTDHKYRALFNAAFRMITWCEKVITVPGKETHAIPTGYGFAPYQNYVRVHSSCVASQKSSILPSADMYRPLFKFGVFNAVQSSCFDTVRKKALHRYR